MDLCVRMREWHQALSAFLGSNPIETNLHFHGTLRQAKLFSRRDSLGSSHCGTAVRNPTRIHEDAGSIPGSTLWEGDLALL